MVKHPHLIFLYKPITGADLSYFIFRVVGSTKTGMEVMALLLLSLWLVRSILSGTALEVLHCYLD